MDIQNTTSTNNYVFAEIRRRHDAAAVAGIGSAALATTVKVGRSEGGTDECVTAVTSDALASILDHHLCQPTKLRKETEEPYPAILNARTKHALEAYLAQANLPQYETKSALSQMLGVDDYA